MRELSEPGAEAATAPRGLGVEAALAFLLMLTAGHFVVDTVASIVSPIWPALEKHLFSAGGSILWIYVIWNLTTSLSQFFFGYLGDRRGGRWLIWAGPAVAVVALNGIGLTSSPVVAAILLAVGGLGIAAFHPEAAALAGASLPEHRSRAMSIFAVGGYLGQAAGPYYSGTLTDHLGLPGLAWGILWGLPLVALLIWAMRKTPETLEVTNGNRVSLGQVFAGKEAAVALTLTIQTLRVVTAMGVPLAVAYLLDARGSSNAEIGIVQSIFQAGIGFGGLACAAWVRRDWERRVLWLLPLCAAPVLVVLPYGSGGLLWTAAGVMGLLLGIMLPVMISYGQQLLPHGQRVASSITMGVSWGTGGAIVAGTIHLLRSLDRIELAFIVFAIASVLSGLISFWLPRIDEQ